MNPEDDGPPSDTLETLTFTTDQSTRSHLRIAYRFAERFKREFIHVRGLGWMYWADTRWAPAEHGEVENALFRLIGDSVPEAHRDASLKADLASAQSSAGTRGVLAQAEKLAPFAHVAAELDNDRLLINLQNGTFDLRSMTLKPHDPGDLITKIANAGFYRDASATRWEKFVQEVLPDEEVRDFLRRYIGVALSGEVREHALPILLGDGRNGKGTFYEAVQYMQGEYAHQADPELFMSKDGRHPVSQMALLGRRFVVVTETDRGRRMNAATMKRLTGGDPITARWLYGQPVTFEPSHTPILVTNWMPTVTGDERAAWERIHIVEFSTYIPREKRDKHLKDTLRTEVDGVLLWALRGWHDYVSRGYQLDPPTAVLSSTEAQRRSVDYVAQFLEETTVIDSDGKVLQKELSGNYNSWRLHADKARNEAPEYVAGDFARVVKQYNRAIGTARGAKGAAYFTGIRVRHQGE